MTKQERLRAVLAFKDTDYIPCGFWSHFPKAYMVGEKSVEKHLEFYRKTDVDILKVMNEHLYRLDEKVAKPADWRNIRPIDVGASHYTAYFQEIKAIRKAVGNDVPLIATIHGLLVSACHATDGPNQFARRKNLVTTHLKEDPNSVCEGLRAIAQSLADLCEACVSAGADGIYYAQLGSEEDRFSGEFFTRYVAPIEISILERAKKSGITILHVCKDHVRLPLFVDYPCDAVNWDIHDCRYSLAQARELFPRTCLLGGFDDRDGELVNGSDEAISKKIKSIVSEADRRGLIIGADCTLPTEISLARVRRTIEFVRTIQ